MRRTGGSAHKGRSEAEERCHALRNIAAALEGGLRVLDESNGDVRLVRAARAAMGHQVEQLLAIVERTQTAASDELPG